MNFIPKKAAGKFVGAATEQITEQIETHVESNKKTYVTGAVCLAIGYILGTKRQQPVHNLIVKL